jgi:hypothetical protein
MPHALAGAGKNIKNAVIDDDTENSNLFALQTKRKMIIVICQQCSVSNRQLLRVAREFILTEILWVVIIQG